jgi:hypothetical protein
MALGLKAELGGSSGHGEAMRRRDFIKSIGCGAALWPLAARAQQGAMPVVGTLYAVSATAWAHQMTGFRVGLGETGFIEGRNVVIEYRWAEGHYDRLPALATELVGRKVAVLLAGGSVVAVRAAMAATRSIPIVFTTGLDPVADGLVPSLRRLPPPRPPTRSRPSSQSTATIPRPKMTTMTRMSSRTAFSRSASAPPTSCAR